MASRKRMFNSLVIDCDNFLDMPLSTQSLYFHLAMRADDDGFIDNQKRIQRMIGASDDDLKLLIAKRFLITFESGVIVIRHWKLHNCIQKDRYKETLYTSEKAQLYLEKNKSYTLQEPPYITVTDTQVSIGEASEDKEKPKPKRSQRKKIEKKDYFDNKLLNETFNKFIEYRKETKHKMTDTAIELMIKKLDSMATTDNEKIEILEQSIVNGWQGIFPIKNNKNNTPQTKWSDSDSGSANPAEVLGL